MKKWLTRCAVTAALLLIVLLAVQRSPQTTGMWVGNALPTGKVRPQLAVIEGVGEAWLLAPDGSLWGWGASGSACSFTLAATPRRFGSDCHWLKLATSRVQALSLKEDGSLWGWGLTRQVTNGDYSTPTRIGTATNWVQAAAGVRECLALKQDGSLWAWGYNDMGALGDGTTNLLSNPTMIGSDHDWQTVAASQGTSFAVKTNGTLWAWGDIDGKVETTPQQFDPGTNWVMIAAGEFEMMALKSDGTIWRKAISSHHPESLTQIGRDHDWKEIDVRLLSYFAVKADGSRWGWGFINGTNAALPERLPTWFAASSDAPQESPRSGQFPPGTALVLTEDGGLWTRGNRICTVQGAPRWRIENFLAPLARHWTPLGNLFKPKADKTPYRLWELPPEVRQSLGTGTKGTTSDGITTQSPNAPNK
jgi:hypothetical protein